MIDGHSHHGATFSAEAKKSCPSAFRATYHDRGMCLLGGYVDSVSILKESQ